MTVDWACELYHCVTLNPSDSGLGVRVVSLITLNPSDSGLGVRVVSLCDINSR